MTVRQFYEALLIELNKVQAPAVLLEDFNYFGNKAIGQYINKMYNLYDINQQKSDDLRVLKSTAILIPEMSADLESSNLLVNTYETYLPDDYVHMLGCVVEFEAVKPRYKCYLEGDLVQYNAKRLTADMFPAIMNNYYMKPSYKNPYYYINNINLNNRYPTRDNQVVLKEEVVNAVEVAVLWEVYTAYDLNTIVKFEEDGGILTFYRCIVAHTSTTELDENSFQFEGSIPPISPGIYPPFMISYELYDTQVSGERYGNKSKVRMEIRYGKENGIFIPSKVYIDYLKSPQFIRLTQEQIDEVSDISQLLEFPDYVCHEIINELTKLLLESASDPRLQTNIPINQTIGNQQR